MRTRSKISQAWSSPLSCPSLGLLGDREDQCRVEREALVDDGVRREVDDGDVLAERLGSLLGRVGTEEGDGLWGVERRDPLDLFARSGQRLELEPAARDRAQLGIFDFAELVTGESFLQLLRPRRA